MRVLLAAIILALICTSCTVALISHTDNQESNVDATPAIPVEFKEKVTVRHVDKYIGRDAQDICDELGKEHTYRNFNNRNTVEFDISSHNGTTTADLTCKHDYTKQVGIYTQMDKYIETKPVTFSLKEIYDDNNQNLINMEIADTHINKKES